MTAILAASCRVGRDAETLVAEIDPTRILLYPPNMTVRPVQISMDNDLLGRIDCDPEARDKGRSSFIRSAVRLYLKAKERREIEARLADAYAGEADALLEEIEALMGEQSWPTD